MSCQVGFLADCTGLICDASLALFHRISRLIDAHEQLWDSFARHLQLDEDFISENYLFASGGGSPSQHFILRLRQRRPHMTVKIFKAMLEMYNMNDISTLLDGVNDDMFFEYINWKIENIICSRLNSPREQPRWKSMADTCGFSPSEIVEIENAIRMNNLYSPTTRILNAYRWQFPDDNFDKIREFIADNFNCNR